MAVLNDLFDTFLHNIEPDDEAVSYAQDAPPADTGTLGARRPI